MKFSLGERPSTIVHVDLRIDDEGDVCLEANGTPLLYLYANTGKLGRCYIGESLHKSGFALDAGGYIELE